MVVSVPNINKCLSLSETKDITDFVGAPLTTVALVVNALGFELIGFHSNVFLPFLMLQLIFLQNYLKTKMQDRLSKVEAKEAAPQPV